LKCLLRRTKAILLAVTFALSACSANQAQSPLSGTEIRATTVSSKHSEATSPESVRQCIPSEKLKNEYTVELLNHLMFNCAMRGQLDRALFLYALSGVYGNYDALRVSDPSSREAATLIRNVVLLALQSNPERYRQFKSYVVATLQDKVKRKMICNAIHDFGWPRYFPKYMVDHGLSAMRAEADKAPLSNRGLVANFNESEAWNAALNSYLQCDTAG
jgi:hypothetical protein